MFFRHDWRMFKINLSRQPPVKGLTKIFVLLFFKVFNNKLSYFFKQNIHVNLLIQMAFSVNVYGTYINSRIPRFPECRVLNFTGFSHVVFSCGIIDWSRNLLVLLPPKYKTESQIWLGILQWRGTNYCTVSQAAGEKNFLLSFSSFTLSHFPTGRGKLENYPGVHKLVSEWGSKWVSQWVRV